MLTPDLKVGFFVKSLAGIYQPVTKEYGFFESFPAGIKYGWNVLAGYVGDMKYVFTADGAKTSYPSQPSTVVMCCSCSMR